MNKNNKSFSSRIKDWPPEERPREKLIRFGADSISSAELIAILLGQGTSRQNAVDLAKRLLAEFGSLEALSNASLMEMQQINGIGPAKAVTLLAAFQLYRNLQYEKASRKISSFHNPAEVAGIYQPVIGHLKQECFYVLLLSSSMQKIGDFKISSGLMDASLVHPREVFNQAIKHMAKGIIVMHNHPSGALTPSQQDIDITNRLVESGKIIDIQVYDHLIITADGYFSFKENGLMA